MALHLIKLCVGVADVAELERWQRLRLKQTGQVHHVTRMRPRRAGEITDGGSLYWVIRGKIAVRQKISAIEPFDDDEGVSRCRLVFVPELVPVRPFPKRPFQGWRYLAEHDAPPDLPGSGAEKDMPQAMREELVKLGLL